ncbi:hypothetical protein C8046_10670 [Serinibacter arcticus]|uniref:Pyridoxamine 5'-phosphate oxidase N-terminal domain-containing protein n=1 Tax=Serinibacter arcticus TaxID=1655435 RepID=A0A2U1ZVP6_9MICO|nr:pyridoxamine 5'-phosphate oxidase family protein [Serinibacter arcticus]PWD51041.1 hypothetical protein C8046_10670 [Serinibacter arcticus]
MTAFTFDPENDAHAKALGMLERDLIAWIVTTAEDGSPRAVPVWFFWHDGRLSILSEPGSHKVAHVRRGSPVLVHLQAGGPFGDDVVVLRGSAEVLDRGTLSWLEDHREAYSAKYAEAIEAYGMPIEDIVEKFSTVLTFTPEHLLAW